MSGVVGQLAPGGRYFRGRPVQLEAQPSWTLGQLQLMWSRQYQKDTAVLVAELMRHDWSLLAHTHWPAHLIERRPNVWTYVLGVGRAVPESSQMAPPNRELATPPAEGEKWAYLWEHEGGALHVYTEAGARWRHVAALDADVLTGLNAQMVAEIEQRRQWFRAPSG